MKAEPKLIRISRDELLDYFKTSYDPEVANEQLDSIFNSLDLDESGGVTTHELKLWYCPSCSFHAWSCSRDSLRDEPSKN
jgi:hypothetical protein